jgi:filamentous hemagglutinin
MNKNQFRVIFNAHRGVRMAVAETAMSQGKGVSRDSSGSSGTGLGKAVFALTAGASLVFMCGLLSPPAEAQIVADRNAPGKQQATILSTASGVTQVNIQTPSAAGVSRNTYSQFDVNSKGAILNNSRTNTATQIGGLVQGNPWLANGGARVILNEVNSGSASQIKGFVEVAGQRAEVIIANPAGIAVNGGGFLNASAVTLTTGTPVMNAGNLESFRVRGGTISIDGAGLDTGTADYTNLLARATQVNAGIWAKDLKVVTGANDINAASSAMPSVTATTAGTGTSPSFALDVASIGGMYAGKIFLVGTEAGLGVRNGGVVGASAGDVMLSNDGVLTNSGSIYASGNTSITTQGSITNATGGLIAAQGNTTLQAQGQASQITSTTGSTIAAGMNKAGLVGSTGTLNISASSGAALNGQLASGADTTISALSLDISNSTLTAQNATLTARATRINAAHATTTARGTLTALAQTALVTDGASVNATQLTLSAQDLSNVGGTLLQSGTGDLSVSLAGKLDNTSGTIASNGATTIHAAALVNRGGTLAASETLDAVVTGAIDNSAFGTNKGLIAAKGNVTLAAGTMDNSGGLVNGHAVSINTHSKQVPNQAPGLLNNQLGTILAQGTTRLNTGAINNDGGLIQSGGDLAIDTAGQALTNAHATSYGASNSSATKPAGGIVGLGDVTLATGDINNTEGFVHSNGLLTVTAPQITNSRTLAVAANGDASAQGLEGNSVTLNSTTLANDTGAIRAAEALTIYAGGSIDNAAGLISGQTVSLLDTATAPATRALVITNNAGVVAAGLSNTLTAAGLTGDGQVLSQGDLNLSLTSDFNNTGAVIANNQATITTTATVNNSGLLQAGKTLAVTAQNLTNAATGEISATTTQLRIADTLTNRGLVDGGNGAGTGETQINAQTLNNLGTGRIYGDHISIAATNLNNDAETIAGLKTSATINARQRLDIGAMVLNNSNGASILSQGDMDISGSLDAKRQATGSANTITNSASTIEAQGVLHMKSAVINNLNPDFQWVSDAGTTGASGTIYITPAGTFDTANGGLLSNNDPLVAQAHGGFVYKHSETVSCGSQSDGDGGMPAGCVKPTDMTTVVSYTKGAAQQQSGSAPSTFDAFVSYTQTDYKPVVTVTTPGRIASGAAMTLEASEGVVNDQSLIVAGGALHILSPVTDNRAKTIKLDAVRNGTAYNWDKFDHNCGDDIKGCDYFYYAYRPSSYSATVPSTRVLNTALEESLSTEKLTSKPVGLTGTQTVAQVAAPNGVLAATSQAANTATVVVNTATGQASQGITNIASATSGVHLPTSSLFKINSNPQASYLVETDPRFTNYKSWLGSDYITTQIALDPTVTQKRLGDGFYEQQLLREQVAQLTGRRFLGNFTSDQQEYQALMDSGLTYAKAQNLRPGIALSAQQIALLTTDIAWLQQESVTLADGTVTQALVPHLYAAIRAGDLSPTGGLLSGDTVNLEATGEVRNGGTILGRKVVQITANTINNINGQIGANDIALHAAQDINNVGGTITAQNSLTAIAGRDINVVSTTQSSAGNAGNYSFAQSGVDRLAGLYVKGPGVLLASAGNNVNLTAAQLVGAGNVTVTAGNSINLQTVQSSQSNNFGAGDANNHLLSGQTSDVGTQVSAGNKLTLSAGQNINAKAADLRAQGALDMVAKGNIVLDAGQTQSTLDSARTSSSSGFLSSTSTSTQTKASASTAQATTLNAQSINVQAGNNLLSVGTDFKAKDNIDVGGANSTLLYATQNVNQSTTTNQSSSSLLGINLSKSEVTDSKAQSLAVATSLISDKKIQIGVGNTTELQGTTVQAAQIAFVQTDPTKAGNLILNGSTDTTQTSHTEKSETLGVYQSAAGQGSTVQTLNQTTLKGNVTFDAGLKITAQVPKDVQATPGGQALAKQVQTLQGTLGSSSSGLDYLNQLAANPNVKWDKIALANDKWSYEQAGLTPAGAALLSIAVAAYTGGMGVGALGGTTATAATATTAATAATLAGSAGLATAVNAGFASLAAQAAVAMVNNGGDIGKTLQQLGSEQSIKGLLTTMATAGALQQLGSNPMFTGQSGAGTTAVNSLSTTQTAATFSGQLLKNVTNNLAGSAIDSAINGKAFDEKALGAALTNALITTGLASGAGAIGDARVDGNAAAGTANSLNDFTNKIAHAVLGCAGGAATGGGCSAGAVGAVIGEMTAEYAKDAKLSDSQALALAKTLSAASGVLVGGGGDNAAAVNAAATTGANAAENNYLNHIRPSMLRLSEKEQYDAAATSCATGDKAACGTRDQLVASSKQRDQDLANACSGATPALCNSKAQEATAMGNNVTTIPGSTFTYANSPTPSPLNTATIGTPTRPDSFQDAAAKSTSEAIAVEVGNQAVGALIVVAAKGVGATKTAIADFFASQGITASDATAARIANNFGKDGDAFTTAANQMVTAKNASWTTAEGRTWYPPNNGVVPGTNFDTTLPVGTMLDRYGGTSDKSTFLAPVGTPFEQRALPATTDTLIHDQFVVLKPLPVGQSNTMPWFGQQGMGVQFDTSKGAQMPISELLKQGYLGRVTP